MFTRMAKTVTGAAVTAGAVMLGMPAAQAQAEGASSSNPPVRTYVTSCVDAHEEPNGWLGNYTVINNNCPTTEKVRVQVSAGFTSGCITLGPGDRKTYGYPEFAHFQELVDC